MHISNTCTGLLYTGALFVTNALYKARTVRILDLFHVEQTQLKFEIHRFNMNFFRIMKISFAIFFVFQVLDDFAAGQLNTVVPIGQSGAFPIIHARKSIRFTFYTFVLLNSTLVDYYFIEDLEKTFVVRSRYIYNIILLAQILKRPRANLSVRLSFMRSAQRVEIICFNTNISRSAKPIVIPSLKMNKSKHIYVL